LDKDSSEQSHWATVRWLDVDESGEVDTADVIMNIQYFLRVEKREVRSNEEGQVTNLISEN
jgi:hypothetical protein